MRRRPEFESDVDHKWAALARSHSFPATPALSVATIRLAPFLALVIDRVLDRPR